MNFPKGIYVIVLDLPDIEIGVGSLGRMRFSGKYAYVGSNQRGGRIERHLRKGKVRKWHIDYLTERGKIELVLTMPLKKSAEEELAKFLARRFEVIRGFGNSDCRDPGHLFRFEKRLVNEVKKFADQKGVELTLWKMSGPPE